MTYLAELAAIETRFLANYTATPVAMGVAGPVIDPATKAIVDQPDTSAWVRFLVRGARENQASLGGASANVFRNLGVIMVQVFTPTRDGHAAGRALADSIGAIFRAQQFSGITCRAASVSESASIEGGWIQTNVDIPFYRDAYL